MPPVVASAFLACLASGPKFVDLEKSISPLGFVLDASSEEGTRWVGPKKYQVFRQETPNQYICSVWFDGNYSAESGSFLEKMPRLKARVAESGDDSFGAYWRLNDGSMVRLVAKEGEPNRIGLTYFVAKG